MFCDLDCPLNRTQSMVPLSDPVFDRWIREKVKIDAMQFGLMPGKGTIDAIFTVRQMQEKYGCRSKKLYFVFVELEKPFDRVPREVSTCIWALRKARVDEWLVKAVMAMYEGAQTDSS